MNKYNLNRIERHYMTEVMLTFQYKYGREMTDEEFEKEVEKMRARRAR
jgi:archaeosine-15-forming tRNA-guanine transglycosylase